MVHFGSVQSFQARCVNGLACALAASSDTSTGKVRRLLDYCPVVGSDSCHLNDRGLAAVVGLGLFAVKSKLKTEEDVIVNYLVQLLKSLPSANWTQNTEVAAKKEGLIAEQFCYKLCVILTNISLYCSPPNKIKILEADLSVFQEFFDMNQRPKHSDPDEQLLVTVPAILGLARAMQISISSPKVAFKELFEGSSREKSKEEDSVKGESDGEDDGEVEVGLISDLGVEGTTKLFAQLLDMLSSYQWKALDAKLEQLDNSKLAQLGYPYRFISTIVQYSLINLIRDLATKSRNNLSSTVRTKVLKMGENHISVGVHELSTVTPVGANEKAFQIIKVICVAVESLVWAVQSPSEIQSAFQRFSSLLTVHTSKFSVLVAPLRAAMLEGIAALVDKSPSLVSLALNRFKEFLNSNLLYAVYSDAISSGNLEFATCVKPEVFPKLWSSAVTPIHVSRVDAFVTVQLALGSAVCRTLLIGSSSNSDCIAGFLASLGNQLYTTDASSDCNLRVAECIVMLLGQIAVEVKVQHGVIGSVTAIFQQRLFHPTSNLDGSIVLELGKMAAQTGDSSTIEVLIRLMGLSLGEPIPAYSKRDPGKETSFSHIYTTVVDSLVHVANHLKGKQERYELLDMSLQLFVQQGNEARRASETADTTSSRKATSSSFSLGLLLPVISTLIQRLDPFYEPTQKVVKLFRDFWLYCIIMGFSDFNIGVFPSAWYDNVRKIASRSPLLLSKGAEQFLDKELELNHPLKIENIAHGELQDARQSLIDQLGKSPELDRLVYRLTFVQCMYLQCINRLELLRLETTTKTFILIFNYLEDNGLQGELWIVIEMIANNLFNRYVKLMEDKPANIYRVRELEACAQLLLFKFNHLRGRIKKVADRYLTKLVEKFSHLLWSKTVIHTMFDLLQEMSLTLKDLSSKKAVQVRLPYLDHFTIIPDNFSKREKTVRYFTARCQQIVELAIKWAPIETKTILEDYICSAGTATVGLVHHSAVSLAASIISQYSELNGESIYLPSSVTGSRAKCNKNGLSQPFSNLYLRSSSMGEVVGMKAALKLTAGACGSTDLSTLLCTEIQNSLASVSTYNQAALEEQLAEVLGYISPEGFFYNPVTSCADITTSTSDYYWIRNRTNPTPAQVFCDFNRNCSCNQTGGAWMRVAKLNMTDPSQQCPEGFLLDNTVAPLRLCTRNVTPGCTSLLFDTFDIDYTHVCGRATGYQKGSTDAFDARVDADPIRSLDEIYVDGISLTHGSFPRQHIWTFAAARDETIPSCACTRPDVNYTGLITPQVKEDYFCETGSRNIFEFSRLYVEDPLWDGQGCGDGTTCCSFNNPPWFCRELPQSTTDTVEFRVCTDESSAVDEDILLEAFEIYVS